MVYGGKPSRGCLTCKQRKIKCDESRPICLQCKKSSRDCLGYKDEADLIFRPQNDLVMQKARKLRKIRSTASSGTDSRGQRIDGQLVSSESVSRPSRPDHSIPVKATGCWPSHFYPDNYMPSIRPPPSIPIEEQVVRVYFKNFATLYQSEDTVRGFLPYLVPMYGNSEKGSSLRVATHAAALCAISQLPGQRQLAPRAASAYGEAIKTVYSALKDPVRAKSDETLQATLLLCLYERLNAGQSIKASDNSLTAWSTHVDGAAAIVCSRGSEQFNDPQSVALFRAARTQMVINCIRQETAPKEFPGEGGWLSDTIAADDPHAHVTRCAMVLPYLLQSSRNLREQPRDPHTNSAISVIIEQACEIKNILTEWTSSLPSSYCARTVAYIPDTPEDPENAEAWVGPIHSYTDVQTASVLNKVRACCMLAAVVILDSVVWLRPDDYLLDDRYHHTKWVEQNTIDEICASIPFHLGWRLESRPRDLERMEIISDMIGGYSLIWPLHAAIGSPRISECQRRWLRGRLKKIALECGLEQALLFEHGMAYTMH